MGISTDRATINFREESYMLEQIFSNFRKVSSKLGVSIPTLFIFGLVMGELASAAWEWVKSIAYDTSILLHRAVPFSTPHLHLLRTFTCSLLSVSLETLRAPPAHTRSSALDECEECAKFTFTSPASPILDSHIYLRLTLPFLLGSIRLETSKPLPHNRNTIH